MNKLLRYFIPQGRWKLVALIISGTMVGILILLVYSSRAHSYLSDKPETCINCHVMYPQYATWMHSSHKAVATCNDCHVPQDNFFRTYFFKAMDGLRHATIFTARAEPQVIQIKEAGINVVQENCIRCHKNLVDMVSIVQVTGDSHREGVGFRCWDCHREVPHGTVNSLASTPYSLVPRMESILPSWMQDFFKRQSDKEKK